MTRRSQRLFVYGTLRKGFRLHVVLRKYEVRELGAGAIRAKLFDLGDYPGAVTSASAKDRVAGEVYELLHPHLQLQELDKAEEYDPSDEENSLFLRRLTNVMMKNGGRTRAWAYFLPSKPPKAREISSGDYAEARR